MLLAILILPLSESFADTLAEAFARMPSFTDLAISPGGKYFAARYNSGNRYQVSVFELTESGARYIYGFQEEDTLTIDWFRWVSKDHLLASVAYTAIRRILTYTGLMSRKWQITRGSFEGVEAFATGWPMSAERFGWGTALSMKNILT